MNTTDYFTYVNAMFLFCIFTCGLLVWAVIRGYILKGKLTKEQDSHLKATLINTKLNKALGDEKKVSDNMEKLLRQVETEVRELQEQLSNVSKTADHWIDVAESTVKELESTKAKVRKRDANGKFLPSGNGQVKKVKAESPKLIHGLTVKNPTEDEAKMIFDEALRLGVRLHADGRLPNKSEPWIWVSKFKGDLSVGRCSNRLIGFETFVTAKEFVQRMQNGRA